MPRRKNKNSYIRRIFILLSSNLLRLLILCFLIFQFQNRIYSQHLALSPQYLLKQMSQQLIDGKPDILYFSDTNHSNFKLLSVYTALVKQITEIAPEYNCVFLEVDQQIFQPEIDAFMSGKKSWQDSVGIAQKYWEKITGRSYKQAPELFLNRMRELDLKVFAVDWPDDSSESKTMKNLFSEGFSRDRVSLQKAFELGVNVRNSVMAQNIYQILNMKDEQGKSVCVKTLMFIGGLHLAEDIVMPMGRQKYQSIASHPTLKNSSQKAHEILDCNNLGSMSSIENLEQCNQIRSSEIHSVNIEDLFQQGEFFSITSAISASQTAGNQLSTFPKIQYNIMVLPWDSWISTVFFRLNFE